MNVLWYQHYRGIRDWEKGKFIWGSQIKRFYSITIVTIERFLELTTCTRLTVRSPQYKDIRQILSSRIYH